MPPVTHALQSPAYADPQSLSWGTSGLADYLADQPQWTWDAPEMKLSQAQQIELLQALETDGTGQIQNMIQQGRAIFDQRSTNP